MTEFSWARNLFRSIAAPARRASARDETEGLHVGFIGLIGYVALPAVPPFRLHPPR